MSPMPDDDELAVERGLKARPARAVRRSARPSASHYSVITAGGMVRTKGAAAKKAAKKAGPKKVAKKAGSKRVANKAVGKRVAKKAVAKKAPAKKTGAKKAVRRK